MVTDSGLIVAIPVAEPIVGQHRLRYDQSAAWGVPAHVTVLYPFVLPALIDDAVLARVASVVASVPRFTVTFRRAQWFGDELLWLEPLPSGPFSALTAAVAEAFPECPPYGTS